ncbi:MAG TPA: sigma-70 family RNA polymerase sigma factor [Dehalococcoidia bacterium]|nr:sigma-70 family RNA polymerase sigma factor [Dehalococcoidia bacterium]
MSEPVSGDPPSSQPCRDELIERNLPLVAYVVNRMSASFLSGIMEREDALAYGAKGLIQAVDSYDVSRGVAFSSFASLRIRGAIIDAARELDLLPRSLRRKIRDVESANQELANSLGRWPTVKEVSLRTGLPIHDVHGLMDQRGARVVSLEQSATSHDESYEWEVEDHDEAIDPAAVTDRKAMLKLLGEAMENLPPRDREVIQLRYFKDMPFRSIGKTLNISESRVCQIHVRIITSLRKRIQESIAA